MERHQHETKTVLILSHDSPRTRGLAKYLPEHDWQPITQTAPSITPKPISHSPRIIKLCIKTYQELTNYPDTEKHWNPSQTENINAVISSSSPVTSHIIAKKLKEKHNIPWVADLRDLWTQNHNYMNAHRPYGALRKFFERRLEKQTLATADALVTVSQPLAEKLEALHKKETYVITNGFNSETINNEEALTKKFTITYTGQIYKRKQDPTKLYAALKNLISNGTINPDDLEVRFYGIGNEYGVVPHEVALQKQKESQVLLLLNWEDPHEKGVYPQKVFEYLAARRPILATGGFGNDVVESLLKATNSGKYCPQVNDIETTLTQMYSEYKINGKVSYNGNQMIINKYSHREMARKFAKILNEVCD